MAAVLTSYPALPMMQNIALGPQQNPNTRLHRMMEQIIPLQKQYKQQRNGFVIQYRNGIL